MSQEPHLRTGLQKYLLRPDGIAKLVKAGTDELRFRFLCKLVLFDMEIVTFEKCKVHACNHGNKVSTRIHLFQTFKWYSIELREKLCYLNVAEGWIVDFC